MISPTTVAVTVFVLTYIGMAIGRVPGLKVDRAGIALIAVAALLVSGSFTAAAAAIDMPTLVLMFGLMILSAQFAAAGAYEYCAARIASAAVQPGTLLALTVI